MRIFLCLILSICNTYASVEGQLQGEMQFLKQNAFKENIPNTLKESSTEHTSDQINAPTSGNLQHEIVPIESLYFQDEVKTKASAPKRSR